MSIETIAVADIRLDGQTQVRVEIDLATVAEYAERMAAGDTFPPVTVYRDDAGVLWVADGFHRLLAFKQAQRVELDADVRPGDAEDARFFAASSNAAHGLRRTRADVQHAIQMALTNRNGAGRSDREIADHVGCDHKTVGAVRASLGLSGEIPQIAHRAVTRGGTTYVQNTANIGKGTAKAVGLAEQGELTAELAEQWREKEVLARANDIRARERDTRRASIDNHRREVALSATTTYQVILADPPWKYSNTGFDSSAEKQYPCMATEELEALPVRELGTEDSVLFLWATNPLLPDALQIIAAWGFSYKTNLVWVKDRATGIGFYLRGRHELLLIATRGSMVPAGDLKPESVLESPRREHSRKPDEAYTLIESMYPGCSRIELFARHRREGWAAWGNEL